ncbi:hypothetical protein MGAST_28125 [Mycobacterium gastri 'Wayne']|uniref:Uncharacterized protein n=1 Tax=Mycobacterium gastri TaxID=1777 RepID=A0A1X1VH39_MYCGS|nr:hypothetical protein MGAST_28125 [Mycobacterium gastri 'Wayne']ORV68470.1 hypothetical protein AWC07_08255 [Mycobacterium gastri]
MPQAGAAWRILLSLWAAASAVRTFDDVGGLFDDGICGVRGKGDPDAILRAADTLTEFLRR